MAHLAHYKEAHPLIFVVTHWINLIAMIMLILSGIIIHFPVLPFLTGIARGCHLFFGFVLFINCVARVIMAFFVKTAPTGRHAPAGDRLQDLAAPEGQPSSGPGVDQVLPVPEEGSSPGRQAWPCRRRSATC